MWHEPIAIIINIVNINVRALERLEWTILNVLAKAAIDDASEARTLDRRTERLPHHPILAWPENYSIGVYYTLIVVQAGILDDSLDWIEDLHNSFISLTVFNGKVAQSRVAGLVEERERPTAIWVAVRHGQVTHAQLGYVLSRDNTTIQLRRQVLEGAMLDRDLIRTLNIDCALLTLTVLHLNVIHFDVHALNESEGPRTRACGTLRHR